MNILPIILLDGITFASWLFLVSAGITFIFGVLRILNVAHGSLYAIGAYVGATFIIRFAGQEQHSWLTLPLLLLAAIVVGLTLGPKKTPDESTDPLATPAVSSPAAGRGQCRVLPAGLHSGIQGNHGDTAR